MKSKLTRSITLLLLLVLGVHYQGIAQKIYQKKVTLNINGGLGLIKNTDFGIKSSSSSTIYVRIFNQNLYDTFVKGEVDRRNSLLYGFKCTSNTGGNYENTSYGINERLIWYSNLIKNHYYFAENGMVYDDSNSLKAFKKYILDYQQYEYYQGYNPANPGDVDFYAVGKQTVDVLVEIQLPDNVELSSILGIKIPGTAEIKGSDFAPKTFAFLGNYGCGSNTNSKAVANFVNSTINPDVIVSAGNDSYHHFSSDCGTGFADNVGTLYNRWTLNKKMESVLGNSDYQNASGIHLGLVGEQEWKDYFGRSAPYYSVVYGNVALFMLNTNLRYSPTTDPRNSTDLAAMKLWLTDQLHASKQQYKIVVGHSAVKQSGSTNSSIQDWDFRSMGADMYVSSDADFYERHDVNGIPHVNVGLGGYARNTIDYTSKYPATIVKNTHISSDFGVLKASVGGNFLRFEFFTTAGNKLDEFYLLGWESTNPANNYYLERERGTPIASTTEALDTYLILGQSNASGRCPNWCWRDYVGDQGGELPNTYLLNEKNEFEHAKNAFARYSTTDKFIFNQGLGVGWTFAKTLNAAGKKLGMIVNSRGGVATEEWFPDYVPTAAQKNDYGKLSVGYKGNNLYNEAKLRYKEAKSKYPNIRLKGVIWMQGESDAQVINLDHYDFATRTGELIQKFRDDPDYSVPDLRFLLTEVSDRPAAQFADWSHDLLNKNINQMPAVKSNVFVASVAGLETFDGIQIHWKLDSYKTLGERLAAIEIANASARLTHTEISPMTSTLIPSATDNNFLVYPNPTKDHTFFAEFILKKSGLVRFEIINLAGKLVCQKHNQYFSEGSHKLQIGKAEVKLIAGLYFIKIITPEFTKVSKLVVE